MAEAIVNFEVYVYDETVEHLTEDQAITMALDQIEADDTIHVETFSMKDVDEELEDE